MMAVTLRKNFLNVRSQRRSKTVLGIWNEADRICSLQGTLGFIKSYQSVDVKFIEEHPQCFTFRIILWFHVILRVSI